MPEVIHLKNGDIALYQREDSPRWQFRIRTLDAAGKVKWKRYSAKTVNENEAKDFALEKWNELKFKKKWNIPEGAKSFEFYAKLAKKEMQQNLKGKTPRITYKHYIGVIDNYLLDQFGNMPITSINTNMIEGYKAKLKKEFGHEPSQSTLRTHFAAMRRVFNQAIQKNELEESQIPKMSISGANKSKKRPSFEEEEINEALITFLESYKKRGGKQKVREFRVMLCAMVDFVLLSGLRPPHELTNLTWQHLQIKHTPDNKLQYVKISVKGKTGTREAVADQRLIDVLNELKNINPDFANIKLKDLLGKNDRLVFCYSDGEEPQYWSGGFHRVLNQANLLMDKHDEQARSLYSCRHYYITQRLKKNFNIHKLAVQVGSSVKMLEEFYSGLVPDAFAEELVQVSVNYDLELRVNEEKPYDNQVDYTLLKVLDF